MHISPLLIVSFSTLLLFSCQPASKDPPITKTIPEQAEPERRETGNPITECMFLIGFDAWEPYQYIDVGNKVVGLDIEVANAVLQEMHCQVDFKAGTWVELLDDLKEGEVDILLGASKTPAREEFALFSDAYRSEEYSLYIRKDDLNSQKFNSVSGFIESGRRIGVVEDYYYGPVVSILRDGSVTSKQFVSAIIGEVNVARLLDRDIDGFLEDSFVGASYIRRKALSDYIHPQGIAIQTGDAHIMFSKKNVNSGQVAEFNRILSKLKSSQEYSNIVKRYSQ